MRDKDSMQALTGSIREFAEERDWEQFHDPKSLILAMMGEVGELSELFQWIKADDATAHFADPERKQRAAEEISDVLIYLMRLADVLDIDISDAAAAKLEHSRLRFDPDDVSGVAPDKR